MNVYSTDTSYEHCQKISDSVRHALNGGFTLFMSSLDTNDSKSIEETKGFVISDAAKHFSDYGYYYNREISEKIARKYRFKISLVKEKCKGVGTTFSTKYYREKEPNWAVECTSDLFSRGIKYSK